MSQRPTPPRRERQDPVELVLLPGIVGLIVAVVVHAIARWAGWTA